MLTMGIWWLGILLEALLLVRGLRVGLIRSFPGFYFYLSFVFVDELVRFSVYRWWPSHYSDVYWVTQFLGFVVGSAVIFEIYRVGLRAFPGTAKMARSLLLLVFALVFAKALASGSGGLLSWLARTSIELERDMRIVQAVAILTLLTLFLVYAIPFGRNLGGVLLGFSMFVGTSIFEFTLWLCGVKFHDFWPYAQPLAYDLVLVLWIGALWSHSPAAKTDANLQLEEDYQLLLTATRSEFERALARLGSAARI